MTDVDSDTANRRLFSKHLAAVSGNDQGQRLYSIKCDTRPVLLLLLLYCCCCWHGDGALVAVAACQFAGDERVRRQHDEHRQHVDDAERQHRVRHVDPIIGKASTPSFNTLRERRRVRTSACSLHWVSLSKSTHSRPFGKGDNRNTVHFEASSPSETDELLQPHSFFLALKRFRRTTHSRRAIVTNFNTLQNGPNAAVLVLFCRPV